MKNGNESWDVLGDSRKRYRCPRAETGKYEKKKKRIPYVLRIYMRYISGQPSWRPLQEDSMQISCADNPTFQRLEIRKMDLDRALLPGPSCSPLAYDPSFKGLCVFYFQVVSILINQASKFTCFLRILLLKSAFMTHSGSFNFLQTMLPLKFWICVPNRSHYFV